MAVEAAAEHQSLSSSRWWWLDGHTTHTQKRSPWLHSAISELDEKTKAMLKLIVEDADSFAQRAEMYYRKRPELINMVQDLYRSHRSLAERYDQFKSESGSRGLTPRTSLQLPESKWQSEKLLMGLKSIKKDYDSCSETYELDESDYSDVEDPETPFNKDIKTKGVSLDNGDNCSMRYTEEEVVDDFGESDIEDPEPEEVATGNMSTELVKLREEIERIREENRAQKEQLMQKDEEKREVIRQLSMAMDLLREENMTLRQRITSKDPPKRQKNNRGIEFNKLKDVFWGRIFS